MAKGTKLKKARAGHAASAVDRISGGLSAPTSTPAKSDAVEVEQLAPPGRLLLALRKVLRCGQNLVATHRWLNSTFKDSGAGPAWGVQTAEAVELVRSELAHFRCAVVDACALLPACEPWTDGPEDALAARWTTQVRRELDLAVAVYEYVSTEVERFPNGVPRFGPGPLAKPSAMPERLSAHLDELRGRASDLRAAEARAGPMNGTRAQNSSLVEGLNGLKGGRLFPAPWVASAINVNLCTIRSWIRRGKVKGERRETSVFVDVLDLATKKPQYRAQIAGTLRKQGFLDSAAGGKA